ncbi:AAA family ATPase [Oribacterium sp. NK2B42]|uniref:AAA family ATPase n=1 Tax=Oribacterium sp. NK2B42 TaxID=689781 RepID=UPI000419858B|nr:AAA family ATPase [Oribacterium sp. NK2B42]
MGQYLNPGSQRYQMTVNSRIFVDKTEMICYLNSIINTQQRFVSVSRPRRFGKSIAADMVCAYYDREANDRELFEKRLIAKCPPIETESKSVTWDMYLGKYDVIRIVMTDFIKSDQDVSIGLQKLNKLVVRDLAKKYPDVDYYDKDDLIQSMQDVFDETKRQFVIVIDEWDSVFRERKDDKEGQKKYLDFLRDWMKDKSYIALAYMTGILPIKKFGQQSGLNMFTECSMMFQREMAPYTGFTEEEVKELAFRYGSDFEKMKAWYDGYAVRGIISPEKREEYRKDHYNGHKISIYNPSSVVSSIKTGIIGNYWNNSEIHEALADYIGIKKIDGLKDAINLLMDGGRLKVDTSTYQNDMITFTWLDDVLSLLVHLGYLGFDDEKSEVFIPNLEILDEFKFSVKGAEWVEVFAASR